MWGIIVPGSSGDTGVPHTFYTGDMERFFPDVFHTSASEMEQKMLNWSVSQNRVGAETLVSLRSNIAAQLLDGLRKLYDIRWWMLLSDRISGKLTRTNTSKVQYANYLSGTVLAHDCVLVNLLDHKCDIIQGTDPDDSLSFDILITVNAMKSPHDLTSLTVARALKRRLQSGETYWARLTALNRVVVERHLEEISQAQPPKSKKRSDSGGTHKRPAKKPRTEGPAARGSLTTLSSLSQP